MASETVTAGDPVTELRHAVAACLRAVDHGDHQAARKLADQAESLAAAAGVLPAADAALAAGIVDRTAGDDATAEHMFTRAANLAGRHLATADGMQLYLRAKLELAVLHRLRGDHPQAERVLLDALATSLSGRPVPRDLARLHHELGVVLTGLGEFDQAADSHRTALSLLENLLPQETGEPAAIDRSMNGPAQARGDHQRAPDPSLEPTPAVQADARVRDPRFGPTAKP
jgi:hypothetical protein